MSGINFTQEEKRILLQAIEKFFSDFKDDVRNPVYRELGILPNEIVEFQKFCLKLRDIIANGIGNSSLEIDKIYLPLLKSALISYRHKEADSVIEKKKKTHQPKLHNEIKKTLIQIEAFFDKKWFLNAKPYETPKVSEFLSIQVIENYKESTESFTERMYDEKFGIIMAPTLFYKDLNYYRSRCDLRGVPLMVCYIDIDNFKSFNTNYGEPVVDNLVLPPFMKKLEEFVFSRGYAYRFGGDEYILLMPNVGEKEGLELLKKLHEEIRKIHFNTITDSITVSIGIYFVKPDCSKTNLEIEESAAKAKKYAKEEGGKDCTAIYRDKNLKYEFSLI